MFSSSVFSFFFAASKWNAQIKNLKLLQLENNAILIKSMMLNNQLKYEAGINCCRYKIWGRFFFIKHAIIVLFLSFSHCFVQLFNFYAIFDVVGYFLLF